MAGRPSGQPAGRWAGRHAVGSRQCSSALSEAGHGARGTGAAASEERKFARGERGEERSEEREREMGGRQKRTGGERGENEEGDGIQEGRDT